MLRSLRTAPDDQLVRKCLYVLVPTLFVVVPTTWLSAHLHEKTEVLRDQMALLYLTIGGQQDWDTVL